MMPVIPVNNSGARRAQPHNYTKQKKPLKPKKFGLMTVPPTVQDAAFNMRGQLYRGHTNATALSSSLVVSALSSESDDPGSSPNRGKALRPKGFREKKCELRFQAWLNLYIIDNSSNNTSDVDKDENENDAFSFRVINFKLRTALFILKPYFTIISR